MIIAIEKQGFNPQDLFKFRLKCNRWNCKKTGGFMLYSLSGENLAKANDFVMENCEFIVNKSLRKFSLQTGQFTNHAFIVGNLIKEEMPSTKDLTEIIYRLGRNENFMVGSNPIHKADKVYFIDSKIYF